MSGTAERGSSPAKSAQRAMGVLVLLAQRLRPLPTMMIARELGIPKSSTHHLLNTMLKEGFVAYYDAEHAWGLGVRVFEVGSAYMRTAPLQRLGRPVLERLIEETGETAHLAVLHGSDVLYIDKEQPRGPAPRLVTEVGVRLPAHLTAVGRSILAALPESQVRAVFADRPLVRRTDRGPDSIPELLTQMDEVREAGYALDREMVTPGISCVASPVFSHEGMPLASIGSTFLSAKYGDEGVAQIARHLREASRALSRALGWKPEAAAGDCERAA